jgi:hypothetical protein
VSQLRREKNRLLDAHERLKARLIECHTEKNDLQHGYDVLHAEANSLRDQNTKLQSELVGLQQQLVDLYNYSLKAHDPSATDSATAEPWITSSLPNTATSDASSNIKDETQTQTATHCANQNQSTDSIILLPSTSDQENGTCSVESDGVSNHHSHHSATALSPESSNAMSPALLDSDAESDMDSDADDDGVYVAGAGDNHYRRQAHNTTPLQVPQSRVAPPPMFKKQVDSVFGGVSIADSFSQSYTIQRIDVPETQHTSHLKLVPTTNQSMKQSRFSTEAVRIAPALAQLLQE